jgi:hypothetical protein
MLQRRLHRLVPWWAIVFTIPTLAQTSTPAVSSDPPAASASGSPSSSATSGTYLFPDRTRQFQNYFYNAFGPPALISTGIGAALDQQKPAPPEWDSGAKGYAERYGWRFGMSFIGETTKYTLGAVTHQDVAFHRCECKGFFPRTAHALISTLTAKTRSGHTVFSLPALASPYAGSFTAMSAWYPARYGPADAFRIGSISFAFKAVGNLVGEFIARRR